MPGTPTALGPFKSGLINALDTTSIPDDALAECINFDFGPDGWMTSRPAIVTEANPPIAATRIMPLGYYVRNDGTTFLVATCGTQTWIYDINLKTWLSIWSTAAVSFVQYDNKIVMISDTVAGGYWEAGVFTATPTMPFGSQIVFYQERFWAFGKQGTVDATTVWFSKLNVISPPSSIFTWAPTTDFFTVSKGDGQWITCLTAATNALIISRNSSTYTFRFPSSPLQGTLQPISVTIGCDNMWTVTRYEDYYLVQSQGFLYQFINFRFYPLNTKKIIFGGESFANSRLYDLRLSVLGPRAILFYKGAMWVYNIVQGTWSQWSSPATHAGHFLQIPPTSLTGDNRVALVVTGEQDTTKYGLYRIDEKPLAAGAGETMTGHIKTKAYNLQESAQYKRLMYWTVEALTSSGLIGFAEPIAIGTQTTTWDDMNNLALAPNGWDDLDKGTWDNPLVVVPAIQDNVVFPVLAPTNILAKLIQALRFLRIRFQVNLQFDGTTKTSPAKIYTITPYMKIHASVSKKVS